MSKIIRAIYENGVFKPLDKIDAKEHGRFKLIYIPLEDEESPMDLLHMAEEGGSFDFLKEGEEEVYSVDDGEPL